MLLALPLTISIGSIPVEASKIKSGYDLLLNR
jgi:hypothetical protein